ncbi:TetR/AcrR family transcriptional regulator [Amycolatopsis thermalba]|uniref:TetR/AcrR family transcriptional regulator n=1 Tax=Amycolatopsis thermalba TaxID=944492 RepID=UPI000E2280CA|nr:TetR family transcriptional regulator [Amycolatopsis thermalba]
MTLAGNARMNRQRVSLHRAGITPELVLDEAVAVTADKGLRGWRMRELADRLGVYPAVVYHHVGARGAITAAVVERIAGLVLVPPGGRGWRCCLADLAREIHSVLGRYPGVACEIALQTARNGPPPAIGVPLVVALEEAGIRSRAPEVARRAVRALCWQLAQQDELHQTIPAECLGRLWDQDVALILNGLAADLGG